MPEIATSSITISDTTLKEQANLKTKAQKDIINELIGRLQSCDEGEVRKSCDVLAHSVFIPWLNKQNQVNKIYFYKQGGIKHLVHWMKEAKDVNTQADAGTAIWNFAESSVLHEILWKEGAGQALLEFLKSGVPKLERVAIGALFGLLDYCSNPSNNLSFSPDREFVKRIMEAKQDTWSFNLAKTGCLLSLAKLSDARTEILALGGVNYFQEDKEDVLINYLHSLSLAHLLAENPGMDLEQKRKCEEVLEKQLAVHPVEVRKKESRHGVVWSSTRHLVRLLKDSNPVIRLFALYSFANLSYGDYNRSLIQDEDVMGSILCSQWINDGLQEQKQSFIRVIVQNFGTSLAVPSLFQIGFHHIHSDNRFAHIRSEVAEFFPDLIPSACN